MCDLLLGGPGMCDKVWQVDGGSKLAKNSVTYFMDGPNNETIIIYLKLKLDSPLTRMQ